jgi:raffinose/stachyose/melibiose transport system substrate-binding protein
VSTTSEEQPVHGAALTRGAFLRAMGGGAAALTLPGVLAACGTSSGGGDGATLSITGVADQRTPLEQLTALYKKSNPDTKFKASYAPVDQVQTSVRAQLGAGNAPDVHVLYPGNGSSMAMVQVAQAGLLADLSEQAWTKFIPETFKPAFDYKGKTYVFSAGSSVIGAIYNKKVFQEAGVEPPKTWSELLDVCAKIKKAGKIPIVVGAQTPWVTQLITYALVPSTVYAKDPKFDDQQLAGKTSFEQSGWRDAMEMYLELQRRDFFNPSPNGTTFEQQTSMVATGKAAMAVQVSAVLAGFRDAATSPDDIGMFPFPGADDAAQIRIPAGVVVGLGVSARGKEVDAAKEFIEFLGKPENINRWAQAVAAIPLKRDSGSKIDPVLDSFLPFIDDGKADPFMDQRWPNAEVQPTHFAVIQDLLGDKISVDDALKKMDEAYAKKS